MSSWIIRYSAEVNGLNLKEIKVNNDHPKVEYITISTDDSYKRMVAEISLENVCTQEESVEIGYNIINILFDQIAIECDAPIGIAEKFFCKKKEKQEVSHGEIILPLLSVSGDGMPIYTPSEDQLNTLKDTLKKEPKERNINFLLYRSCISQIDTIAKFMFLYNLLLMIANDDQKKADELITRYEPKVIKTESPRRKRNGEAITETVYTRLRNEIAHKREGYSPENTRKEISSCVNKFQSVIKQAVLEELCPEHR